MATRSCYHRPLAAAALAASLVSVCSAQGLGAKDTIWPRWQARFSLGTVGEPGLASSIPSVWASAPESRVHSASLYGDYYFSLPSLRSPTALGGLRATSGVLFGAAVRGLGASAVPAGPNSSFSLGRTGLPDSADNADSTSPLPYVGLGYTRLSVSGGWGFSADVGLVSQNPGGAWRLGGALFAPQNLDDAMRNLRLSPLVHVDVRYSF